MPRRLLQPVRDALRSGLRWTLRSGVVTSFAVAAGLASLWWLAERGRGPAPMSPLLPALLNGVAVLLVVALGAAWFVWGWRWSGALAHVTVAAVGLFMAGSLLLALSGTPWGIYGLFGDQGFRTEAITRFTQNWANADHAYRGLPGHYPPLVPWVEGRVAVLLDLPGWRMAKIGQVVLAAVVPLLSFLFWRRVISPPAAAAVVAVTALFVGNMYKVDQWLVLAVLVPWWLDAFRQATRPQCRRWPLWVHGVVAGVLLTGYTFYFVPLALATIVGMVVDLVRGRSWLPVLARPLVIGTVGLVVSAWYWFPLVWLRLQGAATGNYQTSWFIPRHTEVVSPLEVSGAGLVMLLGLIYLGVAVRHRVGEGLLLAVVCGYVVVGAGLAATALGNPILVFKAADYIRYCLIAAGMVGVLHLGRVLRHRLTGHELEPAVARMTAVAVVVICLAGSLQFVDSWATGKPVQRAHTTPLPDGSRPTHVDRVPGEVGGGPADPATELVAELDVDENEPPVVVTDRVDLLATTPVYLFVAWTRPYSNPFGEFDERVALLQEMAGSSATEVARLAQDNPYDEIDAFVLRRSGGQSWTYRVKVDNFPLGTRYERLEFSPEQFDDPHWEITRLDRSVVVEAVD